MRGLEEVVGERIDWYEAFRALRYVQARMDDVEDYWERGDGLVLAATDAPYHNLGVYGADVLDVTLLDADLVAERLAEPPEDDLLAQLVEHDNDRAWRTVLESCRAPNGTARTVLDAARAMGDEGLADGGDGPGIETLVVMLGGNNALGSVVHLDVRWTPPDYLDASPRRRLDTKGAFNVWQPAHFQAEWALLVGQLEKIAARHVILATVPQVTIAPIARGWRGKVQRGSRYFPYYVRPWVDDDDFDADRDEHLTDEEAQTVDSAIDAYNLTIIDTVRKARRDGRDWYLLDLAAVLDSLATKRYIEDPAARPPWWEPYELPVELATLDPVPSTRFFESGPQGRTEGGLFSLDGVHPTTIGYGIVAREVMRIMNHRAGVVFRTPTGQVRPPDSVDVDFRRVLASDTPDQSPAAARSRRSCRCSAGSTRPSTGSTCSCPSADRRKPFVNVRVIALDEPGSGFLGCDLDQVAARVIEHGGRDRSHVSRRLREAHPVTYHALVLGRHVVHGERRERDAVFHERLLERARRRVPVGLQ